MASKEFVDAVTPEDLLPLFESVRKSLSYYFASHVVQYPNLRSPRLSKPCGVFVAYRDLKGNVRGCMGLIDTDRPLMFAAVDSAIAAAVEDPRYERIIIDDVTDISLEMTLIKELQDITDGLPEAKARFASGLHGFYAEGGVNAGVLLPRDIDDMKLGFDAALKKVRSKAGLPASAEDLRYYMYETRVFVQAGHNAQVMDLTKKPSAPAKQKKQAKSKKGFLLALFTGDSE